MGLPLGAATVSVAAQEPDSSKVEALARTLRSIDTGSVLRVVGHAFPTRVGVFYGVADDRLLRLGSVGNLEATPLVRIDSIWIRERHTGRYVLVGTGLGAFGGWIIAGAAQRRRAEAGQSSCGIFDVGACLGAWLLGATVGALVGAGAGWVAGELFASWHLRFPL